MNKEELKPCPFCGSECDPEYWMDGEGKQGPGCMECGATAESEEAWNTRKGGSDERPPN